MKLRDNNSNNCMRIPENRSKQNSMKLVNIFLPSQNSIKKTSTKPEAKAIPS